MAQQPSTHFPGRSWSQNLAAEVDFLRSNATSGHFLGASRRAWMSGDTAETRGPRPAVLVNASSIARNQPVQVQRVSSAMDGGLLPGAPAVDGNSTQPLLGGGQAVERSSEPLRLDQLREELTATTISSANAATRSHGQTPTTAITSLSSVSARRPASGATSSISEANMQQQSPLAPPEALRPTDTAPAAQLPELLKTTPPEPMPGTDQMLTTLSNGQVGDSNDQGRGGETSTSHEPLEIIDLTSAPPTQPSVVPGVNKIQPQAPSVLSHHASNNVQTQHIMASTIQGFEPQTTNTISPSTSPAVYNHPSKRPIQTTANEESSNKRMRVETGGRMYIPSGPSLVQPQAPLVTPPPSGTLTQTLDQAMATLRLQGQYNGIVEQRFHLLTLALLHEDQTYLVTHLMYCDIGLPGGFTQQMGQAHADGMRLLETLLFPNAKMPSVAVRFFAAFPVPLANLKERSQWLIGVKSMLTSLGRNWLKVQISCTRRSYPPNAREIHEMLGVSSHTLQRIIFTSLHRQVDTSTTAPWEKIALNLFEQDQFNYESRMASGTSLAQQPLFPEIEAFGMVYFQRKAHFYQSSLGRSPIVPQIVPSTLGPSNIIPSVVRSQDGQAGAEYYKSQQELAFRHGSDMQTRTSNVGGPEHLNSARTATQRLSLQQPNHVLRSSPTVSPNTATTAGATRPLTVVLPGARPLGQETSGRMPNRSGSGTRPQLGKPQPLLPPKGFVLPMTVNPNPLRMALHQAHLRPHVAVKHIASGVEDPGVRLYQYPEALLFRTRAFRSPTPFLSSTFDVSAEFTQRRALDVPSGDGWDPRPRRHFVPGELVFRMRCIRLPASLVEHLEDPWGSLVTYWPPHIFIEFNDIPLELQRKAHHGRDLAIDVTALINAGPNELKVAMQWTSAEEKANQAYAVGIEAVRTCSHGEIVSSLTTVPADTAKSSIIASLNGINTSNDSGDDLTILTEDISIDLIDPFSSRPFTVPARSRHCKHRECFDLESYLLSRTSRPYTTQGPTSPDEWKCPICKARAAPPDLIIDGFLQGVRDELAKRGDLDDAKAIIVRKDGSWEAKMESGVDRSGVTSPEQDAGEAQLATSLTAAVQGEAPPSAPDTPHLPVEIIELD